MEGFMIQGWDSILPGVRWLHKRTAANQRSAGGLVELGFPDDAGQCRPGETPFSSPGCLSCVGMASFMMGTCPRGALASFSSTSQSAIGRWV